jgi:transcriptional regulator with XRE-family HTH domain
MSKPKNDKPLTISDQLRAILQADGRTAYAIGQQADVDPGVISRFIQGERSLRLETVDRIATALGLALTVGAQRDD